MDDTPNPEVVIFTEATELPPAERAAYLERACSGDAELRHRVEVLLQTHGGIGDFLEAPLQQATIEARLKASAGEKAGDRIDRYRLLQQIGEGGYGVVYMAEQEQPVRRRVALKIIKPGMDTKSVVARFEAERQALALMDHPNIAKVFDAGATKSGRPYFVMELVRGVKITEYCDKNSLTTEERLNLFVKVCEAVQHAHQKGIIHRDIKPSNILVTRTLEGAALPMVIDFGIAKATTNQRLTDKTFFTAVEMLIGTPAYMSPEQAILTGADVDTRTDIYSLGVLLYELLTGSTPFDAKKLLNAGLDEVRRVIREQEPVRPSTRLSKMTGANLALIADHRKCDPPKLIRAVCGDLDWIVLKALEKDRTRRYETAIGLALDVKRFLANEPISARPPGRFYKFQKMVLRNKLLFIAIGVIVLFFVASLIVVSTSLAKERRARRETDIALEKARVDESKAQTEAATSQQVKQFLEAMLRGVGPSVARGRDTTILKEILDKTAKRAGNELTNQPAAQEELRTVIGEVYQQLGEYDQAEKMHRAALEINTKLFGTNSQETAASLSNLGEALQSEGKLAEAEATHQEALDIRRQIFGNMDASVATSLDHLGNVYRMHHRFTEAEPLIKEALQIREKIFGENSLEVADSLRSLSIIMGDEGKLDESETMARKVLTIRQKILGSDDPSVAYALDDVAWAAGNNGKMDTGKQLEEQSLAMKRKLLGDEHPDVAKSLYLIGQRLQAEGKLTESDALLSAALSIQRNVLGDDNPDTLYTLRNLSWVFGDEGKWAEAEMADRASLASWRKQFGDESPQAVAALRDLFHALVAQRKLSDAEKLLDEILTPTFIKQPASADFLELRAEAEARHGKWQDAATDAVQAFDFQPSNRDRYCMVAALLVRTHNQPAYEQFRQKILLLFGNTTNIYTADEVAKACLFLPPLEANMQLIGHLADSTVTLGFREEGAMPFFEIGKALSEYRQEHYAAAADWAEKSVNSSRLDAQKHAYGVLAMADWQLGKKDEARTMLAKGNELAPNVLPQQDAEDPGNSWLAWLFARVSLDEATALIQSGEVDNSKSTISNK